MDRTRPPNPGLPSERADRYEPESWGIAPDRPTAPSGPRSDKLASQLLQADAIIGRDAGHNTWELLVSCLPADALTQQFELRSPFFMVLHDLHGGAGRRMLMDLAARLRVPVQRLVIRRQGFGTELACLYFIEMRASNGQVVRLYGSEAKADDVTRTQLKRVLLERCRLGILIAPVLSQAEQDSALTALAQTLYEGHTRARRLVVLPLVDAAPLAAGLAGFSRRVVVPVSIAPAHMRPLENWPFVVACWNQLHALTEKPLQQQWLLEAEWPEEPALASPSQPGDLHTLAGLSESQLNTLGHYARDMSMLKGVESVAIFNVASMQMAARAGCMSPDDESLMKQARALVASLQALGGTMQTGKALYECAVRYAQHHVWLRPVRGVANMLMMVVVNGDSPTDPAALKAEADRLDRQLAAAARTA